ncbi:MAG: xanthine dehydrogenase family protein molybdopterin-binding subunit [Candidatus Tectomicrobia bacterium]|nr:xanthine dehydrogenase family protein molybdopterin-binding subunit [Candidatus Tectomicrobia bacterium]
MSPYEVIGTRLPRVEGVEKATGAAVYGDDVRLPGMLTGRLLLSPHPHALIRSVEVARARRLPGVRAVVTGQDAPRTRHGRGPVRDLIVLPWERVRYAGEPVAAVAAVDEDTAEEALALINVEYEPLPALFDPEAAMAPDAPLIHADLPAPKGAPPGCRNLSAYQLLELGDCAAAFATCDEVFEDAYTTQKMHHGYLEPHSVTAVAEASGKITIWTPTQEVFIARRALAEIFALPMTKLRVIGTRVGGGFGGKFYLLLEPIALLLARACRRAVQLTLSREEEFLASYHRHPARLRMKTGVRRDGTLLARQATLIWDAGAFNGANVVVPPGGGTRVCGPYRIPHQRIEAFSVYTNKVGCGICRAPGDPQAFFAGETQLDAIAEALRLDPLELRLRNALRDGDLEITGKPAHHVAFRETLERAAAELGWRPGAANLRPAPNRGIGIACSHRPSGAQTSSAVVTLNEDGTLTLFTGVVDLTGSDTALTQVLAEELHVGVGRISLVTADTERTPFDSGTGGSKIMFTAGFAVQNAAADLRAQMQRVAAELLEAAAADVVLRDGAALVRGAPDRRLSYAQVSQHAHQRSGGPLIGRGSFQSKVRPGPAFAVQVADVEVDPDTGKVLVHRLFAAHDLGLAVNPLAVEGQIEGGVLQGIGYALMEETVVRDGVVLNPHLTDYRMPTPLDQPPIVACIVEAGLGEGPYGAKAIGEPPCVPTAAALANAIYHAVGVRLHDLPITPERLRLAIQRQRAAEARWQRNRGERDGRNRQGARPSEGISVRRQPAAPPGRRRS